MGGKILGRRSYQCKSILIKSEELRKEKNGDIQMNKDIYRGRTVICRSAKKKSKTGLMKEKPIARMMGMKGMVSINPISAFKGCFFVSSTRRAERVHDQGRILVKGRTILLRKWSPKENMVVHGKFRGLVSIERLAKETLKLVDLTKAKLWVEMLPNVVLPALLEVEDGVRTYTVAVSVTGEDDEVDTVTSETTRSKNEWVKAGGCVSQSSKVAEGLRDRIRGNECYIRRLLPRARYRHSRKSLANKEENGRGRSSLGPVEENFIGPSVPEISFKAHTERAQSGMRIRGLQAGPEAPQAH
ncbi:hypothetical protein CK203_064980 [Vitis vinifera]|uniref:DUF4283 domain-containing protein n=1 Tax=Vitis vinifera TaxID=29760 RepID=A0A438G2W1_VITVI|nr:hypothetical protein CK203_064980 [Vitis vinifera]